MSQPEQAIIECPNCKEHFLASTNRVYDVTVGGTEKRRLPVFSCKDCGISVAIDPVEPDGKFILSGPSS